MFRVRLITENGCETLGGVQFRDSKWGHWMLNESIKVGGVGVLVVSVGVACQVNT